MKKSLFIGLLLLAGSLFFAQEQDLSRTRYAFVVGNQAYAEYPLKTNVEDAKLIASSLSSKEFEVTLKTDITYEELSSEISTFITKVNSNPNSVVLFYFTGHGFTLDEQNYLLSIDNDKYHDEEEAKEYAINLQKDVADKIYTNAQVYILDGAYENPFKKEGTRALGIKGGLSAAKSEKESTVGFLFSASPDALVLEPTGKNTLFASTLSDQILNSTENISDIFNFVKDTVSAETENQQIPYSSTTTMQFAFNGNELIALQKISAQKKSDDLLVESYEIKRSYEADQVELMLQKSNAAKNADEKTQRLIEEANERKRLQAEEDQRRAEEEAIRASERDAYEQMEIEAKRQEFLDSERELRASLQKDSSVEERIEYIESLKTQLNQLRAVSMNQMIEFANEKNTALDNRIEEIRNSPLSIAEKDSEGNITPDAKKRRQQKVDNAILTNKQEIETYNKEKYQQMKKDDQQVLPLLSNAYNKLEGASYVATSINDSLMVRIGDYDGQNATWKLHISSSFFDYENLCDEYLDLSYTDVTGSKKTDITKMTDEELEEYNTNIEVYNSLFNSSTPVFYVKLTYQIMRWKSASEYHFIPVKCEVIRLGKKSKVIRTVKKQDLKPENFILYPQEEVRSKEEIKKDVERANKLLESEKKDELKREEKKNAEKIKATEAYLNNLIEDNSTDNTYIINENSYTSYYEEMKAQEEEELKKEKLAKKKEPKVKERIGKSGISLTYSLTPTTMFTPVEPSFMYPVGNTNPFFNSVGLKLTTRWNNFLYSGATIDYMFDNYGSKLNNNAALPQYTIGGTVLTGLCLPIGNRVRLFGEGNFNYTANVINQTKPTEKQAALDNALGFGAGGGIDIILKSNWFFTLGYNYNWQHYISTLKFFGAADYCQTSLYLGAGRTW